MTQRIFSILFLVIAAALLLWWFAAGHRAWTSAQSLVTVTTKDELFGTTVTTQKWVDDFTPGFLPFSNMNASGNASGSASIVYSMIGFLGIGPLAFLFLAAALWLWIVARKKTRKTA